MSTQLIRASVETRLATWAATNAVPVAWENTPFTKPASGAYVEPFLIPNAILPRDTSAQNSTYLGFYQVNVWIRVGTGMGQAEALAESIRTAFPIVPRQNGLQIEKVEISRPLDDISGWVATPVLLRYRYDT